MVQGQSLPNDVKASEVLYCDVIFKNLFTEISQNPFLGTLPIRNHDNNMKLIICI